MKLVILKSEVTCAIIHIFTILDIASATSFLKDFESRTREENALVYGLFSVLCPKLDENSKKLVCELIDTVFTHTVLSSSTESDCERVAQAVKEQLNVESMQPNMDLVSKVGMPL